MQLQFHSDLRYHYSSSWYKSTTATGKKFQVVFQNKKKSNVHQERREKGLAHQTIHSLVPRPYSNLF